MENEGVVTFDYAGKDVLVVGGSSGIGNGIAQAFRVPLQATAGSVIIISSISAIKASKGNPAYSASKAGAIAFDADTGPSLGSRRHPGEWSCARISRYKTHQDDHRAPAAHGPDSRRSDGNANGSRG